MSAIMKKLFVIYLDGRLDSIIDDEKEAIKEVKYLNSIFTSIKIKLVNEYNVAPPISYPATRWTIRSLKRWMGAGGYFTRHVTPRKGFVSFYLHSERRVFHPTETIGTKVYLTKKARRWATILCKMGLNDPLRI